ncbi:MAG TPA: hypothetical protein VGC36_14410 [Rhizomicrobium sp.]
MDKRVTSKQDQEDRTVGEVSRAFWTRPALRSCPMSLSEILSTVTTDGEGSQS